MIQIIDMVIHVDKYISYLLLEFGPVIYAILFLIILAETGFVLTPFLPGDSLLFVLGAFAAKGDLNIMTILLLLTVAAVLGDSINYYAGKNFGSRILKNSRWVKKEYIEKTEAFYQKHGGKTIIMARFVPIIRTFAPFVAGISSMEYRRFLSYNVIGGIAWVFLLVLAGYFFGTIPIVERNLSIVIFAIIIISLIPLAIQVAKHKLGKKNNS